MIVGSDEADCVAHGVRPPRPPDPMDVILRLRRKIEIDDVRDSLDVDAARGDVGGHQDAHRAALEGAQRLQPLTLASIGVQCGRGDARLRKLSRDLVRAVLGPGEHEHRVQGLIAKKVQQQRNLAALRHFVDKLGDCLRRIRSPADLHEMGTLQKFGGQRFNLFRQRGRKEQRLPLPWKGAHDLPDVGEESHVQHPVGFIQDGHLDLRKVDEPSAHEVEQPAGRGHDDLHPRPQRGDLRILAHAAVDRGASQMNMAAVVAHEFFCLQGQLTSGSDDQRANAFAAHARSVCGEQVQDRQCECRGFPRSGLGDADDIAAAEDERNGFALNGSRLCVAGFPNCFGQIRA